MGVDAAKLRCALVGLLLAGVLPVQAQPESQALLSGPLEISADSADIDRSGVMVYTGDVEFSSPTLRMDGARLEVRQQANKGIALVLTGSPARMQHTPAASDGGPEVHARADSIAFDQDSGVVTYEGNVVMTRGRDRLSGETLRYDLNSQRILAEGGSGGGRVRITIDPETLERARE